MKKIEAIKYIESNNFRIGNTFIYAIYLTMAKKELSGLLINNYKNLVIRDECIKHLIRNHQNEDFSEIIQYFIDLFIESKGRDKISIGKILTDFDDRFSNEQRKKIYLNGINSKKISERKRSYKQVLYIYSAEKRDELLNNWFTYKDLQIIDIFLEREDQVFFEDNYESIMNNSEMPQKTKNKILNTLGKKKSSLINGLINENPIAYLSASYYANNRNVKKHLPRILNSATSIGELSYCIWCIGKLKLYEDLIKNMPLINKIAEKLPKTTYEMLEDRF